MAKITKLLSLDVSSQNRIQEIVAKQYDKDSRFLKIQLVNEGTPIVIDQTSTVTINASRADSTSKAFIGEVNNDGTVTVPITYWMLELDDKVCCDVSVVDTQGRKLSTLGFAIEVEHANYSGNEIGEDENNDLISSLIVRISEVEESCLQSKVLTGSGSPPEPSGYIGKIYIDTDTGGVYIETPKEGTSPNFHEISFSADVDKKLNEKMDDVDYAYLPKYRTGANHILHFGGFSESSTEYQIDHLSEVIDPSVAYFVAKDGKETYIQPELITEELKTKYHVSSGMGNDARYYIPITDELIVLEYYIRSTEAYYYLHTSADSIGTVEEVYVGKAQKLIDDSYDSYYNLWSARKTKECIDALRQSANYTVPVVDSPPTAHLPTEQGQMYMEERTNKVYIAVEDDGGTPVWKEVPFSESIDGKLDKSNITQSTGQSTTAVMSQKATTVEINALKSDITDLQTALIGVSDLIGGDA